MIVTTAQEQNLINECSGCCPVPLCDPPSKICESKTGESGCDDYAADYSAWLIRLNAWVAEDPENRDPEDYLAIEAPPTEPEGYDDYVHGCFGPFQAPEIEPTEDMPTIYRRHRTEQVYTPHAGRWEIHSSNAFTGPDPEFGIDGSGFTRLRRDDITTGTGMETIGNAFAEEGVIIICETSPEEYEVELLGGGPIDYGDLNLDDTLPPPECTSSTRKLWIEKNHWTRDDTIPSKPECPVTYPEGFGDHDLINADITEEDYYTTTLSDPVTKAELVAAALSRVPVEWPDEPTGFLCVASMVVSWPTLADLMVTPEDEDPEDEELPEPYYPECADELAPVETSVLAVATPIRYKMGIPDTDSYGGYTDAHAQWVIFHAVWLGADPETRGEEPIEPRLRSVYDLQWDEVFFPKEWEDWKELKDAFDAATAAHEAWEECMEAAVGEEEEEACGEEPTVPDDPGAEPTRPSLVASRSWEWAGSVATDDDKRSDWFEIAAPETEGQTRIVNVMVICYHCTRTGVLPTVHGETFKLDEEEP